MSDLWYGFRFKEFDFEGKRAIVVFPEEINKNGKLALKVEYWGDFPDIEINLLKRGFHIAYVTNESRFATESDCDRKAHFVEFLALKYGLSKKCVPIGMSCGGAHAVRFAGFYPELISCVYIDAPVLNYCDFPGKLGDADCERVWENEFIKAYPGIKRYQLVNFSEHPLNMIDNLIEHKIPILMVYGGEDRTVIYESNGQIMEDAYEGNRLLKVIKLPLRGHHPHGMIGDNSEIVNYIIEHC